MTIEKDRTADQSLLPPLPGAPFNGRRFANLSGLTPKGFVEALRWMATRKKQKWPRDLQPLRSGTPSERVDNETIHVVVLGHSTVLLQLAGLNILTDPMLSTTAGPLAWLGVKRVQQPALTLDKLPTIDVVLLSHNHYDHLDRPTLDALAMRDNPLILTGLKVGRAVPSKKVVELDWWQSRQIGIGVLATYVPAEHFSARGPFDRNMSLWGGFVLETRLGAIYFAGDTGDGGHFSAIRDRFGPMALSLLPIGAYEPRWFMKPVHLNPEEAVAASQTLESRISLAIHYGTFPLADDAYDAPLAALDRAIQGAEKNGYVRDFRAPRFGEPIIIS